VQLKHTPTPWKTDGLEIWSDGPRRLNSISAGTPKIAHACLHDDVEGWNGLGNAARIVQCVNERDETIDLLTLALPYIEEAAKDPVNKGEHVQALANRIRRIVEAA
jgi:hypothetical protein